MGLRRTVNDDNVDKVLFWEGDTVFQCNLRCVFVRNSIQTTLGLLLVHHITQFFFYLNDTCYVFHRQSMDVTLGELLYLIAAIHWH